MSGSKATVGRLFVLDLSGGHVFSLNANGSDRKVIVTDCRHPDGIVVDVEAGLGDLDGQHGAECLLGDGCQLFHARSNACCRSGS